MSDIYNSLYKDLQPKRFGKSGPPDEIRMEFGSAFEGAFERWMAGRIFADQERPGEFAALSSGKIVPVGTPKSIIFSPDQLFYNGVVRLGEFKSTWMTLVNGIEDPKFDKWWCQMQAYGFPLKMPQQLLVAYFVNGHGKWVEYDVPGVGPLPPGPLIRAWDVVFTQVQLRRNWDMLMAHAEKKGMDI
jgi:hypothetical protein